MLWLHKIICRILSSTNRERTLLMQETPFNNVAEMKAYMMWSEYSHMAEKSIAIQLILLRHFRYTRLSDRDKKQLQKLQKLLNDNVQDFITGPLPSIHYQGPSDIAKQFIAIVTKQPFHKMFHELHNLEYGKVLFRIHADDIPRFDKFRLDMKERFETVKDQVIADLKEIGKITDKDVQMTLDQVGQEMEKEAHDTIESGETRVYQSESVNDIFHGLSLEDVLKERHDFLACIQLEQPKDQY